MSEIKPPAGDLVDEFGELQRKVDAFKPTQDRYKEVKEQIEGCYSSAPANAEYIAYGWLYEVHIGAKKWERTILNMTRLFGILKKQRFLELCGFTLKNLDAQKLTEAQLERIIEKEQCGARSVKPILKAPAEKAA